MSERQHDPVGEGTVSETATPQRAGSRKTQSAGLTELQKVMVERRRQHCQKEPPLCREFPETPGAIGVEEDDRLYPLNMSEAFRTAGPQQQVYLLNQAVAALENTLLPSKRNTCMALEAAQVVAALLAGINPQSAVEGALAVRMIAVHDRIMDALRLAAVPGPAPAMCRFHMNRAARLLRTFKGQIETLRKCRAGGSPRRRVEHVHGNEGGEATVGSMRLPRENTAARN